MSSFDTDYKELRKSFQEQDLLLKTEIEKLIDQLIWSVIVLAAGYFACHLVYWALR